MDMIKRLSKDECSFFQRTFKVLIFIAFLQPLLFSCKSVPISSTRGEDEFAQFLYKKSKTSVSKYYSSDQVNITIKDGEVSKSVKTKVSIQKGDFIFVNINILGIELGRAEITPDSIKIINRIEKTYYFNKLEEINSILKLNLAYNQIENLILKGLILEGNESFKKFKSHIAENNDYYIYVYKKSGIPDITSYFFKDSFQEYKLEIGNNLSDVHLVATFMNYHDLNTYPKEINVTFKRQEYRAEVKIEIGKISNNKIGNRSFDVNNKYREIEF